MSEKYTPGQRKKAFLISTGSSLSSGFIASIVTQFLHKNGNIKGDHIAKTFQAFMGGSLVGGFLGCIIAGVVLAKEKEELERQNRAKGKAKGKGRIPRKSKQ